MADNELSLIKFCSINFFAVIMQSRPFYPIQTLLIKLVKSLVYSEQKPNKEFIKRIEWISKNTHEEIQTPLSIVELIVFRNLDKGVSYEVEIGNKTFFLSDLYDILDKITEELTLIVISITKQYSLDMPLMNFSVSSGIQEIGVKR